MTERPTEGQSRQIKERMLDRLRQIGWSQKKLADETGEPYRNVNRWLGGDVSMPAGFVGLYAKAVPVDARWLTTGEGEAEPGTPKDAKRSMNRRAMADMWFAIMEHYNLRIDAYVQAMAAHTKTLGFDIETGRDLLRQMPDEDRSPELAWLIEKLEEAMRGQESMSVDRTRSVAYGERPPAADDEAARDTAT